MLSTLLRRLLLSLPLALLAATAPAVQAQTGQGQSGTGFTNSREAMWPAPTAEQWKLPCLITWQRTWPDAVELAQQTGQMILVCVNMDGEIASEHYAGVRYRQPEIAVLYEPYITVIASVYRHTPRDHDYEGRRIPCPRFGTVTCGEHIALEPILFEQFMDGQRVAPRHIGVELDGSETYDKYYAFDTDSVFKQIEDGIADRPHTPPPTDRPDLTLEEQVTSPDVEDRQAVEEAYTAGDTGVRRRIMRAAIAGADGAAPDLLRLAVYDLDVEMNRLARRALAQATSEAAIGLINDALRAPMAPEEREMLVAALERLGETYPRARTLAIVHRGLDARSDTVEVQAWASYGGTGTRAVEGNRTVLEDHLEGRTRSSRPRDSGALLDYAEALLALAVAPDTVTSLAADTKNGAQFASLMYEDVQRTVLRAEELGSEDWRVDALAALSAYNLGNYEESYARAEAAVESMPAGDESWNSMAVMALFAQARRQALDRALLRREEWPGHWLTDLNAAYSVLARHPLGTDEQVADHYDFLRRLGGSGQAQRVLDHGLARFPASWALHGRLRARILEEHGVAGLEPAYETLLAAEDAPADTAWFAAYASLVAAEYHRRANAGGEAVASYGRAIGYYERCIEDDPEAAANADHYIAIALAGRARLALEREEYALALEEILAAFARRPEAAGALDGMGLSAVATASTLRARLAARGDTERAARLQGALDRLAALDPGLLQLPAFESVGPQGQLAPRRPGPPARSPSR